MKDKNTQIPGNGHRVFRKRESVSVYEKLHRGINCIIQLRPRCNSIITKKSLYNMSEGSPRLEKLE